MENPDIYINSDYTVGFIKNRNITEKDKLKFLSMINNENKIQVINEIINIELSLDIFDLYERQIILRNCARYVNNIDGGAEIYKKIINKKFMDENFNIQSKNSIFDILEIKGVEKEQSIQDEVLKDALEDKQIQLVNLINTSNAGIGQIYSENVVMNGSMGHGYAAELCNDLYDNLTGKDATIIGSDLKKNGADRLVDGVQIQTKYCKTGSKCISECFEDGKLRYLNSDGSPMKIEVPSDMYEDAVKSMENRIKNGEVPGVTDIKEAKNIVKKGRFTYIQAKNVAKFGKIESITYDAIKGIRVMGTTFGISTLITFACSVWNGESLENSFNEAIKAGMKIGGVSWINSIIVSQIGRTGIEKGLRPFTDYLVKNIDTKTINNLVNGLRNGTNNIYGAAAMNNLSKVLRGNIVSSTVSTAILSCVDINRLVKGEISGKQAFKNITTTATGVVGGGMGATGGAMIGATVGSVIPCVGTAIGAAVGGVIGGISASTTMSNATKKALDNFIEDDAKAMTKILIEQMELVIYDYLLNKDEMKRIIDRILKKDINKTLRLIFISDRREKYAYNIIEKYAIDELRRRRFIKNPFRECYKLV